MMRIALFLATNLAIIIVASVTLNILGVQHYLDQNGQLNLTSLLIFCGVFGSASCIEVNFIDDPLPDGCCSQGSSSSKNKCCWKNSSVIAKDNFVPTLYNEVLSIIQPLNLSSTIFVITLLSFDASPFLLLVNQQP